MPNALGNYFSKTIDNEIGSLTEKLNVVNGDVLMIENSEDSYGKEFVTMTNLKDYISDGLVENPM